MSTDVNFDGLLLVMAVAVVVPLLLGLVPRVPIPSSVLEIAAGIVIGPAVLDLGAQRLRHQRVREVGRRAAPVPRLFPAGALARLRRSRPAGESSAPAVELP